MVGDLGRATWTEVNLVLRPTWIEADGLEPLRAATLRPDDPLKLSGRIAGLAYPWRAELPLQIASVPWPPSEAVR